MVVEPHQGNSGVLWDSEEQSSHIPTPLLKGCGELFSDTQAGADGSLWDLLLPFPANIPLPASSPFRCNPLSRLGLILMECPCVSLKKKKELRSLRSLALWHGIIPSFHGRGWNTMILKIPSNPKHSVIL